MRSELIMMAQDLAGELECLGIEDVRAIDILDCLAMAGLTLRPTALNEASEAYCELIQTTSR